MQKVDEKDDYDFKNQPRNRNSIHHFGIEYLIGALHEFHIRGTRRWKIWKSAS